jgi:hypothetical protein
MFNKGEIIEFLLAEYDEETKEFMLPRIATLEEEAFNSMIKQMGIKPLTKGYYIFI